MLHEVMQKCLAERSWDDTFMEKCVDKSVMDRLGDLVKIGLEQDAAKREIMDGQRDWGRFVTGV
jgi:DNA replication ATP-dependent helicase Dna2